MDNRRKTFVINKQFQHHYALVAVALTILAINIFLILKMLIPGDQPLVITTSRAAIIGAVELLLIMAVWYGSLKLTHRIAGPVYVIAREIEKLGRGNLNAEIHLRDKDDFQDQAKAMNESIAELRIRIAAIKETASKLKVPENTETGANDSLIRELQDGLAQFDVETNA